MEAYSLYLNIISTIGFIMTKTKLIAIYFPQFHQTPENDEWWGNGFTDWNLVKDASPLYSGHYQPRIPKQGYYNPCDPAVLEYQSKLAKEYGIYGFMFYHYWFDGKLMLEKPLEVLLAHKEIEMPFFMSWANGTWTRQWLGKNEILLEQKHLVDKNIWKAHFDYLLPFFKDSRYIKIDNKPIFSIYCPDIVKHQEDLFCFWNELAKEEGFDGIHFMAIKNYDFSNPSFLKNFDSMMKFQPREANTSNKNPNRQKLNSSKLYRILPERMRLFLGDFKRKISGFTHINSNQIWDYILSNACQNDYYKENSKLKIYESAFFSWDNTPRYRNHATIYSSLSKDEKRQYFSDLYKKTAINEDEFIFFNAWNEWSECAYLEPDDRYDLENLMIIKDIVQENE